jgi:DNA-directed RNA polymerase specialized sigma24 family protein
LLDPEPGPEEVLDEAQRHELFVSLVSSFSTTLGEPDRRIVLMHWLEGCSLLVICRRVNMCESSVCSVLRRAKPKLAERLRQAGIGIA